MSDPNNPPQPGPTPGEQPQGYGQNLPPQGGQQPPVPPQQPNAGGQYGAPGPQGQPGHQGQQPPQGQPAGGGSGAQPFTRDEENLWSLLSHLIVIISIICLAAFKDRSERVNRNAKEALNFQITAIGALIAVTILSAILTNIPFVGWIIGIFAWLLTTAIWIGWLIFAIIAGVKCYQGEDYEYPLSLRLIK